MISFNLSQCFTLLLALQLRLFPLILGSSGLLELTERQLTVPTFIQEPPNRVDFLNELGVTIPCQVSTVPGFTTPQIQWLGSDNKILQSISNFRTILPNGTLQLHPFPPAAYRQDLHTTTYRCTATSSAGTLRSRDVHIRAVVAQPWLVKVKSEPAEPNSKQRKSPILMKCEIDLIGGGRDFIEVIGWKWDQHHLGVKPHSVSGAGGGGRNHLTTLPNGDLIIDRLQSEDIRAKIHCFTRHKLTRQEVESPPFFFSFSESSSEPKSPSILERFPDPVVVREGSPVVLHCVGAYLHGRVRWEKSSGGTWVELVSFSLDKSMVQVGNSLVILKSKRTHSGQYRCSYSKSSPGSSSGNSVDISHVEYHVRVGGDSLYVKATINQDKSPLGASAEILCTTSSEQPVSISWYKDNNLINPGGRLRLLSNNILQISQIQREDQGVYQCFGRKERDSAQSAVRLQLADSPPRLLLGFLDQTVGGPGPDISLRCVFHSGFPLPTIVWTIDGFIPATDSRIIVGDHVTSHGDMISYFNITGTRVEDGGLYTCTAKNKVDSVRHSARLNIYGAPWVRVVPPVVAISGEFLEIQCPVSGYPIAGISWEKDGLKLPLNPRQRVAPNGTLTITSVDRVADGGMYSCSAWDTQGRTARRDIQVNVVAPLRLAPFAERSSVVEDERVTLVCALSSGLGSLKWTKVSIVTGLERIGGDRGSGSNQDSPFTVMDTDGFTSLLSIATVKPSHAGVYTCTAVDAISTVSRSHELTVLVPVKIEPFAFQEGLREGARSRLVCGVTQGDLPITFTFYKDDLPLEFGQKINTANISITSLDPWSKVLQFSYLTSIHTGQYTCQVFNPASKTFYTAKLLVQVGPKWVQEPVDVNVSRGDDANFDCFGTGVPVPTIKWFKSTGDGLDIKWRPVETFWPSGNVDALQNGSLIFLEAEEHHEGQYMCKIENGIGSGASKIVHLEVSVPPYFTKTLERQSVSQGKSHEVICEVHGDSPMSVAWMKGEIVFDNVPANRFYTTVHREGKKTRVTLVMKNLDPLLDKGIYQCSANNSLGKVSQTFELWVEERPNPPNNLNVVEVGSRQVVLEWFPPHLQTSRGEDSSPSPSPVLMYLVEYFLAGEKSAFSTQRVDVLGEMTQVKVENLFPSSTYVFRVAAVNSAGNGQPAEVSVRTLSAPPSGPPTNVRARPTPNRRAVISWSPVSAELSHGDILGYQIYLASHLSNENAKEIVVPVDGVSFILSSNHILNESYYGISHKNVDKSNDAKDGGSSCCQYMVNGLIPFTQYEIHVSALNSAGASPNSQSILIRTLEDVPGSSVRIPNCVRLSSQSLQLSWQPPVVSNGLVNSYKIVYYPIASSSQRFLETHQTSGVTTVISGLQPSTNYSFHITAVNIAGESPEWLAVFCKTLEDVPGPPMELVGHPNSNNSIYLNWIPPRRSNGALTHYTVYFRIVDGGSDSFESKRKVSSTAVSYLESQLDLTRHKYVFWMTSSNSKGESLPSTQIVLVPPPLVKPRLVGQSRVIEIHQGHSLNLHCGIIGLPASSTITSASVRWSVNGGKSLPLTGNPFIKPGQNELIFVSLRKSDTGNYTCQPDEYGRRIMSGAVTYRLRVKGFPSVPHVVYRLESRNIVVSWSMTMESKDKDREHEDSPLGFTLFFRSLGSIQEWKKIDLLPTSRNYTLKNLSCGSIVNIYMTAFNDAGTSSDSPPISVHVTHQISSLPQTQQLLLVNSTSVRLNLYPLNSNSSYCPTNFFAVSVRESKPTEWVTGKEDQIPFRNEYTVGGLKEATSYEILLSTFGYSSTKSVAITFVTLNRYGELPAVDITTNNMVRDYSPFYANLTLIIPIVIAGLAVIAALASVLAYCKTRRVVDHMSSLAARQPRPLPPYETPTESKGSFPYREQFYATLPCPPYNPTTVVPNRNLDPNMYSDMEDVSPYATFQLSDPMKKFHEEGFSQEIVVPKFYDVMQQQTYKPCRGEKRWDTTTVYDDRWTARRKSLPASEEDDAEEEEEDDDDDDTESELGHRYTKLPSQRNMNMNVSMEGKTVNVGNLTKQPNSNLRFPKHLLHHTIHNHHLSYDAAVGKTPGVGSGSSGVIVTSLGSSGEGMNSKALPRFGGVSMEPDSTAPEPSPLYQHHQLSSKKKLTSDQKKVSSTTAERVKRNKDGGKKKSIHEPDVSKSRDIIGALAGDLKPNDDVTTGNIVSRQNSTRPSSQSQGVVVLPHESDYSIAV